MGNIGSTLILALSVRSPTSPFPLVRRLLTNKGIAMVTPKKEQHANEWRTPGGGNKFLILIYRQQVAPPIMIGFCYKLDLWIRIPTNCGTNKGRRWWGHWRILTLEMKWTRIKGETVLWIRVTHVGDWFYYLQMCHKHDIEMPELCSRFIVPASFN